MSIVVLGSESFIGKHIIKYFGTSVTPITHKNIDLTFYDDVKKFFDNNTFEYVILCSCVGKARTYDPEDTVEQNLRMFINVISFAHRFKKVIWFSSGADESTRYGFSKHVMERLSLHEKNVICLRLFGCFGIDELPTRFLSTCIREGYVKIDRDRYFDFFDVRDVCRVIEKCFTTHNIPWKIDLVYKEKYKLSQLATMIGSICSVIADSENEYTGIRGQLDFFNLEFQPMSFLLQKFREDYIHNQHLQGSSRDVPLVETHHT